MKNYFLPAIIFLTAAAQSALGASVTGTVIDESGQPVTQSTLCLSSQTGATAAAPACLQTQATDAQGNYAFNAVDAGAYVVTVTDNRFPAYTWLPVARNVTVAQSDAVTAFNFKRQFSFSNFHNPIISGSDLPELAAFNLSQDVVYVKAYAVDPANPSQQIMFFLGRIQDAASLSFTASAPWTVKQVIYEIYSPTASVQGALVIQS